MTIQINHRKSNNTIAKKNLEIRSFWLPAFEDERSMGRFCGPEWVD